MSQSALGLQSGLEGRLQWVSVLRSRWGRFRTYDRDRFHAYGRGRFTLQSGSEHTLAVEVGSRWAPVSALCEVGTGFMLTVRVSSALTVGRRFPLTVGVGSHFTVGAGFTLTGSVTVRVGSALAVGVGSALTAAVGVTVGTTVTANSMRRLGTLHYHLLSSAGISNKHRASRLC